MEQVAFAFSKTELMKPFRELLKKDSKYSWTPELQLAFDTAKSEIVNLVLKGVKTFQTNAWTCIVSDWSRTGVGYALWQKRCQCQKIHLSCCKEGWALIVQLGIREAHSTRRSQAPHWPPHVEELR